MAAKKKAPRRGKTAPRRGKQRPSRPKTPKKPKKPQKATKAAEKHPPEPIDPERTPSGRRRPRSRGPRPGWPDRFIAALKLNPNVTMAADSVGLVNTDIAYQLRKRDPDFAARWQAAIEHSLENLEAEAWRRARQGTQEPVWRNDSKGNPVMVGTITRYSDTLTIFLLKAHKPDRYRERGSLELTGQGGGPVQVTSDPNVIAALQKVYGNEVPGDDQEGGSDAA